MTTFHCTNCNKPIIHMRLRETGEPQYYLKKIYRHTSQNEYFCDEGCLNKHDLMKAGYKIERMTTK